MDNIGEPALSFYLVADIKAGAIECHRAVVRAVNAEIRVYPDDAAFSRNVAIGQLRAAPIADYAVKRIGTGGSISVMNTEKRIVIHERSQNSPLIFTYAEKFVVEIFD